MSEYDRGYADGLEAGRRARRNAQADTALGEMVGLVVIGTLEEVIAEECNFAESEEYRKGFRDGVEAS